MSMIERLAELAKGATLALELERYDHGSGRLTTVVKGMRLIVADVNGEQDREFYAACNPAAIAQAAAEHAAVVAERDALKVRNGELEQLLSAASDYVAAIAKEAAKEIEADVNGCGGMNIAARLLEDIDAALTPSPQSEQEEVGNG